PEPSAKAFKSYVAILDTQQRVSSHTSKLNEQIPDIYNGPYRASQLDAARVSSGCSPAATGPGYGRYGVASGSTNARYPERRARSAGRSGAAGGGARPRSRGTN